MYLKTLLICWLSVIAGISTAQHDIKLLLQKPVGFDRLPFNKHSIDNGPELPAISPDGQWLATSNTFATIIWDLRSKIQVKTLPKGLPAGEDMKYFTQQKWEERYTNIAFLPGSNYLIGIQEIKLDGPFEKRHSLMVWDWQNERLLHRTPLGNIDAADLTYTPDGAKILLATRERIDNERGYRLRVRLWSFPGGELLLDGNKPARTDGAGTIQVRLLSNQQEVVIAEIGRSIREPFIDVWNVQTDLVTRSFAPKADWSDAFLLDFALDQQEKYLTAIYRPPYSEKVDKDLTHAIRWDFASGELVTKPGLGGFYAKKKASQIYFLSPDGRYLYDEYENISDLESPEVGRIPQLAQCLGTRGTVCAIPMPGVPTTIIDVNVQSNYCFNTDNNDGSIALVDYLAGEIDFFQDPTPGKGIEQIIFGKDGVLCWEGGGLDWWDLSSIYGRQYDLESSRYVGATEAPFPSVKSSSDLLPDGRLSINLNIPEKYQQPEQTYHWAFPDYVFDPKNKAIVPLFSNIDPTLVSRNGEWMIVERELYQRDDQQNKYQSYKQFSPNLIPKIFSNQGDLLYGYTWGKPQEAVLALCQLPECKKVKTFPLPATEKMILSADDRWLILQYEQRVIIFDTKKKRVVADLNGRAMDVRFSFNQQQLLIAYGNRIDFFSIPDFQLLHSKTTDLIWIKSFDPDPEGKRVAITDGRQIKIYDLTSWELILTFVNLPDDQYLMYTPDNYYAMSKDAEKNIGFQYNGEFYTFEHFDLYYHRPDIVIERLGYASPQQIATLSNAYRKRLEKQGVNTTAITPGLDLPTVRLANMQDLPIVSNAATLPLVIQATDEKRLISRLLITVNEVPVLDIKPDADAGLPTSSYHKTVNLRLTEPRNMIEVQVWNNQGIPSVKAKHFVRLAKTVHLDEPDLYLAVIGVSRYKDARMNLRFAAKDARDVKQLFQDRRGAFRQIHSFELLNEEVTKENVIALKAQLQKSRPGDRVILFLAGHGLLDKDLDFYFATHDIDFYNPAQRGIAFSELEDLLTNLPARQKVLLMDACNSGELDKLSVEQELIQENVEEGSLTFRSFGSTGVKSKEGAANAFTVMKDLFYDLRRQSGAVIISAASGGEVAIEGGKTSNGIFTYALLEGMGIGNASGLPADDFEDEQITISELQDYILKRVPELTKGRQRPTSRVEYLYNDFVILDVKGAVDVFDVVNKSLSLETLQDYLSKGGNLNDRDSDGATLLMRVAYEKNDPSLLRWLISHGADPTLKGTIEFEGNRTGYYGNLTSIAAAEGKMGMLQFLIEECKIPVDDREFDQNDRADTGWTALEWAANNGQLEVVQYLIGKGADINAKAPGDQTTALMLAARNGHLEVVKTLLQAGASIHAPDKDYWTALHYAARYGYPEVVQYLIQRGADVNRQTNTGHTPLMMAGINSHFHSFEHLLTAGADPQIRNKEGKTIDDLAQELKMLAVQELLAYQGANRPFFVAIKQKDQATVRRFLQQGASLQEQDPFGASMLMHIVSEFDDVEFIKEVMSFPHDVRQQGVIWSNRINGGFYGNLLCLAAGKGKLDILKFLVAEHQLPIDEREYELRTKAKTGWTALQWAACNREVSAIYYLLSKGANKNIDVDNGDTPPLLYMKGSSTQKTNTISEFVTNKLVTEENINSQDANGWSLWHYAAVNDWVDPALIKNTANFNLQTKKGWTPLMIAARNGFEGFIWTLRDKAKPDLINEDGFTALMVAASNGHTRACRVLIENYTLDCNRKSPTGETALDIARRKGHSSVVKLLEQEKSCR